MNQANPPPAGSLRLPKDVICYLEPSKYTEMRESESTIRATETNLDIIDPARAEAIRRDPPPVMVLNEAAAFLRTSTRTVRNLIRTRQLAHVKAGGRILLRREHLTDYLDRNTLKSA